MTPKKMVQSAEPTPAAGKMTPVKPVSPTEQVLAAKTTPAMPAWLAHLPTTSAMQAWLAGIHHHKRRLRLILGGEILVMAQTKGTSRAHHQLWSFA
jgi:hypothetical protein